MATFGAADDLYTLGDEIGRGASAVVYKCVRQQTGETLAVKCVDTRWQRLAANRDRELVKLKREMDILRKLRHPRIVNLVNIFEEADQAYIVQELVTGGELFDEILRQGSLTEVETRNVMQQLVEGLTYLHQEGVVHRDLKPENILVSARTDEGLQIKIADFGLSKATLSVSPMRTMVGTPQYWAPEVVRAHQTNEPYDHRADMWSVGVLMYVMLAGKYPFSDRESMKSERGAPAFKGPKWTKVSADAVQVIKGLLEAKVENRLTLQALTRHPWLGLPVEEDAEEPSLSRSTSTYQGVPVTGAVQMPRLDSAETKGSEATALPRISEPASTGSSQDSAYARRQEVVVSPAAQAQPSEDIDMQVEDVSEESQMSERFSGNGQAPQAEIQVTNNRDATAIAVRHTNPRCQQQNQCGQVAVRGPVSQSCHDLPCYRLTEMLQIQSEIVSVLEYSIRNLPNSRLLPQLAKLCEQAVNDNNESLKLMSELHNSTEMMLIAFDDIAATVESGDGASALALLSQTKQWIHDASFSVTKARERYLVFGIAMAATLYRHHQGAIADENQVGAIDVDEDAQLSCELLKGARYVGIPPGQDVSTRLQQGYEFWHCLSMLFDRLAKEQSYVEALAVPSAKNDVLRARFQDRLKAMGHVRHMLGGSCGEFVRLAPQIVGSVPRVMALANAQSHGTMSPALSVD
mmetsp:Transcript_24103/g.58614  ORF Transcript_24103/g.58614 Transcript_24103/m.58614 type:complete len:690 (-) Transcript_24103:256-2325(-)